jgi:hypothetical protein
MPRTISTIATTSASFNAAPRYFMILLGGLRLRPLADLSGRPCLVAWPSRRVGGVPRVLGCPFLVIGAPAVMTGLRRQAAKRTKRTGSWAPGKTWTFA